METSSPRYSKRDELAFRKKISRQSICKDLSPQHAVTGARHEDAVVNAQHSVYGAGVTQQPLAVSLPVAPLGSSEAEAKPTALDISENKDSVSLDCKLTVNMTIAPS